MGKIEEFAVTVSAALPEVAALVPTGPAARLGRWEAVRWYRDEDMSPVRSAVHGLGDVFAERLLGALELALDRLSVPIAPELVAGLAQPPDRQFTMSFVVRDGSTAKAAVSIVDQLYPGAVDLVLELVQALRDTASVPDATGDEEQIAARHGAAHFALAVVVSAAVVRSLGPLPVAVSAAVVGVALGAAVLVLPDVPKPAAYPAAVLAKRRAEYRFPQWASSVATVADHRFLLTEGQVPADVDFSGNGLVAAVAGGVAVRTGLAEGRVPVSVRVLAGAPEEVTVAGWDEVAEVGWTAPEGGGCLDGAQPVTGYLPGHRVSRWEAPPWPGEYRVRVHASGRDEGDEGDETYLLEVWPAPAEPEVVHKRTDRLGHRLRGEPEPAVRILPYAEHRWIYKSPLQVAATITVVRGLTAEEVIGALGGRPLEVAPGGVGHQPLQAVLAVDDVVVVVEENGYEGSDHVKLPVLSREGRAGSLYWNVNANYRLMLAEGGELVFRGDPLHDAGAPHTEDLDFEDYRYRHAMGLTVISRFVGRGFSPADLAQVRESGLHFELVD
ncbi:DUF6461 domain-containing protein [Actinosynnema sp. NPDC047251]|uniref:Uncharacterized protein n=1 Tax=Saccharothrix espanaensis (strain ATCC 51144 / DSM 44229 / JCM 9112 / NBRC 15066 / NRRL 15764) TaxID=1179773 RepID=K0K696_SACES|nr:DUF6461 domain-containing protein [Saccharothrix espanaensis]CCH32419.1 hypothetical protein BN6_51530 [Saccharothrix espanaensis DSM 44229]